MYKSEYPTRLQKNVIVDVVFEIRFDAKKGFSNLVPGIAHKLFGENSKIDNYPVHNLPAHIRENNPELRYQPIVRIEWGSVVLMIGDYSLGIGYGTNYPGWEVFKTHIQKLTDWLDQDDLLKSMINTVERYSLKYVDFIPEEQYSHCQLPFLVSAKLGDQEVDSHHKLRLQFESVTNFGFCLFDFNKPIQAVVDNQDVGRGALIITDALRNLSPTVGISDFLKDLEEHKDEMHLTNKRLFFQSLSDELLKILGAQYD